MAYHVLQDQSCAIITEANICLIMALYEYYIVVCLEKES